MVEPQRGFGKKLRSDPKHRRIHHAMSHVSNVAGIGNFGIAWKIIDYHY